MRFVPIKTLPAGRALVDIDKLTHAVPEGAGSHLFFGAQHLDVAHTLSDLENILAGRARTDHGENSTAGLGSGSGWHRTIRLRRATPACPWPPVAPVFRSPAARRANVERHSGF